MKDELLGDHIDILSGFAFKPKHFNTDSLGFPLIRVRDVNTGFSGTYYSGPFDTKYLIKNGDLLVGMDGDFKPILWYKEEAILNQRVCRIEPKNTVDKIYLLHFLPKALDEIHRITTYTTVKHLSVKRINSLKIPLPSLLDQKRIAKVLSDCEQLIRWRKESIQLLDDYLESTFLEMFGPQNVNYDNWEVDSIENYALKKKGSMRSGPFGSNLLHSEFQEVGPVKVLGIDNVVNNTFEIGKPRFITKEKYEQLKRYTVFPGDVLISIMATNGRSAIVPDDIPLAINSKHLAATTLDQNKMLPFYLKYAFQFHPIIRRQLSKYMKGAIMSGLNLTIIKSLRLPNPPIKVQEQFSELVLRLRTVKSELCISLNELQNLYGSISQRAFKGKLF